VGGEVIAVDLEFYGEVLHVQTLSHGKFEVPWVQLADVKKSDRRLAKVAYRGHLISFPSCDYATKSLASKPGVVWLNRDMWQPPRKTEEVPTLENLASIWLTLNEHERKAIHQLASKMQSGGKKHGPLDLTQDKRRWLSELSEELLDAIHYLNFHQMSEESKR
jgi:hypothetical protein